MSDLTARAREMVAISDSSLSDSDSAIARWVLLAVGDRMATNLDELAKEALVAGQVEARVFKSFDRAMTYFSSGAAFGIKAVELEAKGFPLQPRSLATALYCAVLAGDMEVATRLAQAVLRKDRKSDDSAFFEGFARLISASIIDDGLLFSEERIWVEDRLSKHQVYWWTTAHGVYHDLQEAVLARDVARFLKLMDLREGLYASRPKDRKMRDVSLRDGGSAEQNAMVVDYMGAAIAKLARHRGMVFEYDSTFVPAALI